MSETELQSQVLVLMNYKRKIDAIKLVREQRHMGLKEAKDFVEQIESASKPIAIDIETRSPIPLPDYDALDRHRDGDFDPDPGPRAPDDKPWW